MQTNSYSLAVMANPLTEHELCLRQEVKALKEGLFPRWLFSAPRTALCSQHWDRLETLKLPLFRRFTNILTCVSVSWTNFLRCWVPRTGHWKYVHTFYNQAGWSWGTCPFYSEKKGVLYLQSVLFCITSFVLVSDVPWLLVGHLCLCGHPLLTCIEYH